MYEEGGMIVYPIDMKKKYLDEWIHKIPSQYWRNFLQLYMEGLKIFYPAPRESKSVGSYWRMNSETGNIELLFVESSRGACMKYFKEIKNKTLDEIVTKLDWDIRISKILSETT